MPKFVTNQTHIEVSEDYSVSDATIEHMKTLLRASVKIPQPPTLYYAQCRNEFKRAAGPVRSTDQRGPKGKQEYI